MAEKTSWQYVYDRPDLIEEIITNDKEIFGVTTRTMRLIELVEFGARVDYFSTDSETDKRAIELKYSERAKNALADVLESELDALDILSDFLVENWDKEAVVEVEALLSLFKMIHPERALPEITKRLGKIISVMAETGHLYPSAIEALLHFWHSEQKRDDIEEYLLELLEHRDYRNLTLGALAEIKMPSNVLTKRIKQLSDPNTYDENKQLLDLPEERKKMSPSLRIQTGIEYIGDDILLGSIRKSNFQSQTLARKLLEIWEIQN